MLAAGKTRSSMTGALPIQQKCTCAKSIIPMETMPLNSNLPHPPHNLFCPYIQVIPLLFSEYQLTDYLPILHKQHTFCFCCHFRVVGNHQDRSALLIDFF